MSTVKLPGTYTPTYISDHLKVCNKKKTTPLFVIIQFRNQ